MNAKKILSPILRSSMIAGFAVASACATAQPSVELTEARRVYDKAEKSNAPELAPKHMLDARQLMVKAEEAHDRDPGSEREKQYAYLANRKAKIAMARGEIEGAQRDKKQAGEMYVETQSEIIQKTRAENEKLSDAFQTTSNALLRTESELTDINRELANKEDMHSSRVKELEARAEALRTEKEELATKKTELQTSLESEREARIAAEERAKEALTSLEAIALVKAEQNETVITLSGSVVFKTGTATLLPIARQKLDDVATALKAQKEGTRIVVEGHTDSRGGTAFNEDLSRRRAVAVRDYLVSQGVDAERIAAVGRGESEPVASNDSPEGRANNRRVEIVLSGG